MVLATTTSLVSTSVSAIQISSISTTVFISTTSSTKGIVMCWSCVNILYDHENFTDLSIATPSPTVPVDPPSGVSVGAIAGAVIAVIVIILAVLAAVAVIVFVIYRKGLCLFCEAQVCPISRNVICYCRISQ